VLEAVIMLIWGHVNVGDALYFPTDRDYAYRLFEALHRSDYTLDPAYIESWAAANGWADEGGAALRDVAQAVLLGKHGDAEPVSVEGLDQMRWFAWGVQMGREATENARQHSLDSKFVLEAVLVLIHNQVYVNDALFHPNDRGYAYRLLQAVRRSEMLQDLPDSLGRNCCCFHDLRRSDYTLDPTYIERWAAANGWSPKGAVNLREVAQDVLAGKTLRRIGDARPIPLKYVEWFVLGVRKDREVMEKARQPSTSDDRGRS
jgi:hypothetical protein